MSMTTEQTTDQRTVLRTPWGVRLLLLASVVAVAVLVPPYLLGGSTLVTRDGIFQVLLVAHVVAAGTAILLGGLQLVPRIRAHRQVHRWVGRSFLGLGTVAFVVTGLPLALTAGTTFARVGLTVPVLLWPVCAVVGWRAIRRRDVAGHRAWMTRLYAVTFFAITARMVVPLLLLAQLPWILTTYDGDVDRVIGRTVPVGQWLGWMIDLAVAEWLLRRLGRPGRSARAPEVVPG
jgi:uncharacterized membrane protein YozB (DUF420 family)